MRRLVIGLLLSLVAAGSSLFGQEFKATQSRFFPFVRQGVDVELSRFGSYAALADWTDGNSISVFDENRELLWRHKQPYYWGGTLKHSPVLQFAPDESFLIFPGYRTDNDIAVVNPKSGEPYSVLTDHTGNVSSLSLSPDASHLLSYASGELFLWQRDGTSFRVVDRLPGDAPSVTSMAFSPDGTLAATTVTVDVSRQLAVYRVDGNKLSRIYSYSREEHNLSRDFGQVTFSPDGRWIAAGYSDSLVFWRVPAAVQSAGTTTDLQPAQTIASIELGSILSLRFSPDSTTLFSGFYKDLRGYRLDGTQWKTWVTFSPHQGHVNDMEFSLDGKQLAIAGSSESNGLGIWTLSGIGPSPVGEIVSILGGKISVGQKSFLDNTLAVRILSSVKAADVAPRDMFETEQEYAARMARAATQVASLIQEETEKRFAATRRPAPGALYAVAVPLQTQGAYNIDRQIYSFRFMDEEATVRIDRDRARDLYGRWKDARVIATRVQTPDGPTYGDFRLELPSRSELVPVGLSQNPFTGEQLDRYGVRVPSVSVGPDLLIRNLTIDGIFPSLYRYYSDHALGHVELQNIGSATISGVSVQFLVPGFTQSPTAADVPSTLGVGVRESADIRALFAPSILSQSDGAAASAELSVQYSSQGKTYKETVARPVTLLNRNAIRWNDDKKVGAFMFTNDPALLRWSGQVTGMVDDTTTNVLTRNLLTAIRMFEAIRAAGVTYVVDPTSPYASLSRDASAVDFVRFPVETLDQRGGDCDDLSVLYNSLLESVGVNTAYITTPGHILTAFDLGMSQATATKVFAKTDDLIFRDGTTWVPVETTLPEQGFTRAWQTAAIEWREAQSAETANFFTTGSAWSLYPPAAYSAPQAAPVPPKSQVVTLFNDELSAYRKVTFGPKEAELLARLDKSPSASGDNQLGILYAQYGLFPQALDRFKRALAREEYLPAMINAANVLSIGQKYDEARAYLVRAEKIDPNNAHVLMSLAYSYFHDGNQQEAKNAFERASRIDPQLAASYPLFGSSPGTAGSGRASRESGAAEIFTSDWSDGK